MKKIVVGLCTAVLVMGTAGISAFAAEDDSLSMEESVLSRDYAYVGGSITVNAQATGGSGSYSYKYSYRKNGGDWIYVTDYVDDAQQKITMPDKEGFYTIRAAAADSDGGYASKYFYVTVKRAIGGKFRDNNSSLSSTATWVNWTVRGYAKFTGGTAPYKYKYSYKNGSGEWVTAKDYTDSDNVGIKLPDIPGNYTVRISSLDSTGNYASKYCSILVRKDTKTKFADNGSSASLNPANPGRGIKARASFTGGVMPYKYKYSYRKNGKWTDVGGYTYSDTKDITLPSEGSYTIRVAALDATGKYASRYIGINTQEKIVDYNTPYTSSRFNSDVIKLTNTYPELIRKSVAGYSEQGRVITLVTLGNGPRKACVIAGIHAREHITISFTMRCIEEYAKAYYGSGYYGEYNVRDLLNKYTIYFIPMCNPDGTEISVNGADPSVYIKDLDKDEYKANANGVNLNRNFPFNWDAEYKNQSKDPSNPSFAGAYGASESETQAIINLCDNNDFEWLLDMHILGHGMYWRDSKNGVIPGDYELTKALADRCGYAMFENTTESDGYSGGLENWFRGAYNKPSICIEMIPYSQGIRSDTYIGYNSFFDDALVWNKTKYTYLAALAAS